MSPRDQRRRERVRSELRELVLRMCCAAGTIAGLLWTVDTLDTTPARCEERPNDADILSECVQGSLEHVLYPALGKVLAGSIGGMLLALALILTIPGLRPPRSA